ncbi:MAG: AAA family ATPase [Thaumarchaeota archaeon]|nr:AAA family ATPase [Nitrososphaerota archaeon]MDE0266009.1 AAA family ATPase [Nitrososphaerota archaeon]
MWSEKHRPSSVRDMVGNEEPRAAIVTWLAKWKAGTKPLLLVGPPGVGKTTMAFLLAEQFGYDMIGLNASDVRSKSKINEILEPVLGNAAVTGRPAMIFIDEVDGIHGRSDYGGSAALVDIMKRTSVPIILAANDDTHDKMKPVTKAATTVRFRRVPPRLLRAYLEGVLKSEDAGSPDGPSKRVGYGMLIKIVNRSRGDIRSMMNLAQSYATGFNPQTETPDDVLAAEQAVPAFFGAESAEEAAGVLRRMQFDPREKIAAFYSSVVTSRGLDPAVMAELLRIISDADVLYGRIMRTQNWRLLRYLDGLLLSMYGVTAAAAAAATKGAGPSGASGSDGAAAAIKYAKYNLPWPLLTRIRFDGAKIRALAAAVRPALHVSASTFGSMFLLYMLHCMKSGAIVTPDPKEDENGEIIAKEAARLGASRG